MSDVGRGPVGPGSGSRPKVVIFERDGAPRVEVLQLPETTQIGSRLEHFGRMWEVIGRRSRSGVLLARPVGR